MLEREWPLNAHAEIDQLSTRTFTLSSAFNYCDQDFPPYPLTPPHSYPRVSSPKEASASDGSTPVDMTPSYHDTTTAATE